MVSTTPKFGAKCAVRPPTAGDSVATPTPKRPVFVQRAAIAKVIRSPPLLGLYLRGGYDARALVHVLLHVFAELLGCSARHVEPEVDELLADARILDCLLHFAIELPSELARQF